MQQCFSSVREVCCDSCAKMTVTQLKGDHIEQLGCQLCEIQADPLDIVHAVACSWCYLLGGCELPANEAGKDFNMKLLSVMVSSEKSGGLTVIQAVCLQQGRSHGVADAGETDSKSEGNLCVKI